MLQRYYFHFRDADTFVEDTKGVILSGLDDAKLQAEAAIRELLAEQHATCATVGVQRLEVCDDDGFMYLALPFTDYLPRHADQIFVYPFDDVA